MAGACHTLTHHHVHHLKRLHKHGNSQSGQRQGLPVQSSTTGADDTGHPLGSLVHHACLDLQRPLIGQPAVGKDLPQTVGSYCKGGDGNNQAVAGGHLFHNGFHVILAAENAFRRLLFHHHLHHTGLAAGAGINLCIVEIEPDDLCPLCLAGHQRFFQQDFRIATGSSAVDTHDLHESFLLFILAIKLPLVPSSIVPQRFSIGYFILFIQHNQME